MTTPTTVTAGQAQLPLLAGIPRAVGRLVGFGRMGGRAEEATRSKWGAGSALGRVGYMRATLVCCEKGCRSLSGFPAFTVLAYFRRHNATQRT